MTEEYRTKPCEPANRVHNFPDGADVCQCGRMKQRAGHVELVPIEMETSERFEPNYEELVKTGRTSHDKVNPSHYDGDACMRTIAMLGYARQFCIGQAIKYLWRAGRKQGESVVDDVGKARWYLDWLRGFQTKDVADKDVVRFMLETACGAALADELPVERLANLLHMMQYTPEFTT